MGTHDDDDELLAALDALIVGDAADAPRPRELDDDEVASGGGGSRRRASAAAIEARDVRAGGSGRDGQHGARASPDARRRGPSAAASRRRPACAREFE